MSARKGFWMAVGCAGIIGLLAFGGVILQSGGFLTLAADFNEQQLPFSVAAWKGVRSGSPWLWGVDLGSSLITTFSFYNLGSPFFWLTLPFPVDSFPRLAGFLFILKYMTAAGSGYVYLRRFCGTPAAVTGALIYAFSGFQATNLMFSHFHDVVAFFPLLLTGLEDHLRENGTGFRGLSELSGQLFFLRPERGVSGGLFPFPRGLAAAPPAYAAKGGRLPVVRGVGRLYGGHPVSAQPPVCPRERKKRGRFFRFGSDVPSGGSAASREGSFAAGGHDGEPVRREAV